MAKVADLIRRTNRMIDDTIDNIDLIDWFNQCQNEISNIVYLPKKATLNKDEDGEYPLPDDYLDTLIIKTPNITCRVFNGKLVDVSGDESTIDIEYNRKQTPIINSPDFIPDIPEQFHDLFVFYASKMALMADEEDDRIMAYDREYLKRLAELKRYMDRQRPMLNQWGVVR